MRHGYRTEPRLGAAPSADRCWSSRSRTVALNVTLFIDGAEGLLPAAGHRPARRRRSRRRRTSRSRRCRRSSPSVVDDDRAAIPAVESVLGFTGGGGGGGGAQQHRPHVRRAQARRTSATLSADEVIARLRGPLADDARRADLPAGGAGPAHRRPAGQRAVPVHAAGRERRGAGRRWAPRCSRGLRSMPQLADVNSDQQDRGLRGDAGGRPRHRVAPRHHGAADRRHALRRVRPAPGRDHLHAAQPVPRRDGGGAALLAAPRDAARHLRALGRRRAGAAQRLRALRAAADDTWRSTTRASSRR